MILDINALSRLDGVGLRGNLQWMQGGPCINHTCTESERGGVLTGFYPAEFPFGFLSQQQPCFRSEDRCDVDSALARACS